MTDGGAGGAMLLVAAMFIVLVGLNDGASILAVGIRGAPRRPAVALGALTGAVVVVPVVIGTRVASTLERSTGNGPLPALIAFGSAGIVVLGLRRRGAPTSLTLALVGGLTGTAVGYGVTAPWSMLGRAVLLGLAAPVVGALLAWLVIRALPRIQPAAPAAQSVRWGHHLSFGATCLAYAANDGQKALAVALVATTQLPGATRAGSSAALLAVVGGLFALGAAIGVSRNVAGLVAPIRPLDAMTAEACSAVAVLGSGLAGTPVSTTQSITGAVIGSAAAGGAGKVRWGLAGRLGLAWVTTLPTAFAVAAMLAALLRTATP